MESLGQRMTSYSKYPLGCIHHFELRAHLGLPWPFSISCQISRVEHGLDSYLRILLIISCYLHHGIQIYF
jgi:hypothetical protein